MPRTNLTPQVLAGPYEANPYTVAAFAAGDAVNGNMFSINGDQILIVRNTGAGANTITVTSSPLNGRIKDVTALSIAAGAVVVFSKFNTPGWRQTDGKLYFTVSHIEIVCAVIDLANNRSFS